jgi:hypothetical protein
MTSADGLLAAALLYAATLILIAIGYRFHREVIRKPAALLAIAAAAAGSFLLVKHSPAGAEWTPLAWTPADPPPGKPVRLSFPVRQGSLTDGAATGHGRAARLDLKGQRPGSGSEMEDDSAAAPAGGGGSTSGSWLGGLLSNASYRHPSRVIQDCPHCPEMVIVPGGTFTMGAAATDRDATEAERPAREVRVWPGFAIGRYEVTSGEYRKFSVSTGRVPASCAGASDAPASSESDRMPVSCISWRDAAAYVGWLRATTGKPFRLPTAAEWEYAARAGSGAGVPPQETAAPSANRVEETPANAWNIHGQGGNLAEIVADCWQASLGALVPDPETGCGMRMLKDGGWNEPFATQRPSGRRPLAAAAALPTVGFRLAMDLR